MILELLTHEYFWLSFFPIAFLGVGFWILYFDRQDDTKEPFILLLLALCAGSVSAISFEWMGSILQLQNFFVLIAGEELLKIFCALVIMELLKRRFKSISQGIMYGFAVGMGFAFTENMAYLFSEFSNTGFSDSFWLQFQGQFWGRSLLHGITTGFFGLFYAGAYLSKTLEKGKNESPLRVFFIPPHWRQLWYILTLHVTREHLILHRRVSNVSHHAARTVICEGIFVSILLHSLFNGALEFSKPLIAFAIAFLGMIYLGRYSQNT